MSIERRHVKVFRPDERPDVEVHVGDDWLPGEVRQQWQEEDGWWVEVQYRPEGTHSRTIASFPAARVRADTVDRSRGRAV